MNAVAFLSQSFHAHTGPSAPPAAHGAEMTFTHYRLPDGTVVPVDASAAKDAPAIGFTLRDGRVVTATRVE
jgi:hypothetical protein